MIIPAQTEWHPPSAALSPDRLLADRPRWDIPRMSGGDITQVEISFHSPAERIAALVGERGAEDELDTTTDHAWLVVLGQFAQALGLVKDLECVPIDQKQGPNSPSQTKLIELLVGILGGMEYLQDLNQGAHPIARNPTVSKDCAKAWSMDELVRTLPGPA